MIKNKIILVLVLSFLINFTGLESFAHHDSSFNNQSTAIEEDENSLSNLLKDFTAVYRKLTKSRNKEDRNAGRKLRLIYRQILIGLRADTSDKCFNLIKKAADDFYSLVNDLNIGISCGPSIIPIFFDLVEEPISPDCALPPEEDEITTDQIGGPFSEVFPIYEDADKIFNTDVDLNEIPDICEAE